MKFKEIREKYKSKFPTSLVAAAVKIALDMGGNMTGAYKKIEAMKRGLGDDPAVKDALRLANEEAVKYPNRKDVKKGLAKYGIKVQEDAEDITEFATSMTYFNMKGATKAEKIAKGIGIYKSTEKKGKAPHFAYTVHVDGKFDEIEKWSRLI